MMRHWPLLPLLLALGCTETQVIEPAPVAHIVIGGGDLSLGPGDTLQLGALALDEAGNRLFDRPITWRSADSLRLRVDSTGRIIGVAEGVTAVIVASGETEDTAPVHVIRAWAAVMPLSWETGLGCLQRPSGALWCWGRYGLAGIPESLATPLTFAQLDGGDYHACGRTAAGVGYCWGDDSKGFDRLGYYEPFGFAAVPNTPVVGGFTFSKVSGGGEHSCGLTSSGVGICWGRGMEGQLGRVFVDAGLPDSVPGLPTVRDIQAGFRSTCALDLSGVVQCWGWGYMLPIVDDSAGWEVYVPTPISGLPAMDTIAVQDDAACGLSTSGEAWCWGEAERRSLGLGADRAPIAIPGGHTFTSIAFGYAACGLSSTGAAWCWGAGGYLGDGTFEPSTVPVRVIDVPPFVKIFAGGYGVCGITSGGSAWCWGPQGLFEGQGERPRQVPDL